MGSSSRFPEPSLTKDFSTKCRRLTEKNRLNNDPRQLRTLAIEEAVVASDGCT